MFNRIILSRKGFDSSSHGGGRPNILFKNRLYPIPFPESGCGISYDELEFFPGTDYLIVMNDLGIDKFNECHLDPFFPSRYRIEKTRDWPGSLGQAGAANEVLKKNNVGRGDLFLFFAWFEQVIFKQGHFRYRKDHRFPTGMHMVYGYLQVDRAIDIEVELAEPWLIRHPHYIHRKRYGLSNTLYIARDRLDFAPNLPGTGIFPFSEDLILTAQEHHRSMWLLPECLSESNQEKEFFKQDRWTQKNGNQFLVNANVRAQEIVIARPNRQAKIWAKGLVERNARG